MVLFPGRTPQSVANIGAGAAQGQLARSALLVQPAVVTIFFAMPDLPQGLLACIAHYDVAAPVPPENHIRE